MPGYSGTPLAKKLGLKEGQRVALVGAPRGFRDTLEPVPPRIRWQTDLRACAIAEVWSGLKFVRRLKDR